jgi:anaerobic ribonucleoside-triphosphate reductase activating protein
MTRVRDLVDRIRVVPGIEGITITGGEPFEQAAPLVQLAYRVRAAGLSVMAFTGFEIGELLTYHQQTLLALCDVVVAGRYRQHERSLDLGWRGPANQTVHFLTYRYTLASIPETSECEVHIATDGEPHSDRIPAGRPGRASRNALTTTDTG